jgi:hypothetical protein
MASAASPPVPSWTINVFTSEGSGGALPVILSPTNTVRELKQAVRVVVGLSRWPRRALHGRGGGGGGGFPRP